MIYASVNSCGQKPDFGFQAVKAFPVSKFKP